MASPTVRQLKDAAADAAAKGKWAKALECYAAIERAEPNEGLWAQKEGEAHRRLGHRDEAIAALNRAAEVYSKYGFLLKAIAVCKLILEQDPTHVSTQAKLAALHAKRTPPRPAAKPAPAGPPTPAASTGALSLSALVPGSREWVEETGPDAGVFEIPIEVEEPAQAPAATPDATPEEALKAVLPKTPLFSALEERHLRRLIEKVRLVQLGPDEFLFQQGDRADALFVVASGDLTVMVRSEADASMVEVSRLTEGSFFGEIALLAEQPRSATVRSNVPSELLAIDREVISELVRDSPEILGVLLRFVRDRLLNSLLESNKLFAPLSRREQLMLAARLRFLEVNRGARLLQQGKSSSGFFILQAGNVTMSRGGKEIRTLLPGDVFGDQPLLDNAPSTFDVVAESKSFLLALNPAEFADAMAAHPKMLETIRALSADANARPASEVAGPMATRVPPR